MRRAPWIILTTVTVLLLFSFTASASMLIPASEQAKENAKAPEKSPVISLTPAGNWELDRVDFIHYAKPSGLPAKKVKETGYSLLGYKWKSFPVSYVINPTNPAGLSSGLVTAAIAAAAETWDNATSLELFGDLYSGILPLYMACRTFRTRSLLAITRTTT